MDIAIPTFALPLCFHGVLPSSHRLEPFGVAGCRARADFPQLLRGYSTHLLSQERIVVQSTSPPCGMNLEKPGVKVTLHNKCKAGMPRDE